MEFEDDRIEEFAVRRTLPGLLRFAVEAASKDRLYGRAIRAGAANRRTCQNGKFQGMMASTGPRGW